MPKIAPSILSADFARLGAEVEEARLAGADYIHVDVMDGIFVPNISLGIPVLKSLRHATDMFLDVHLMIERPLRYVEAFCAAGADLVNVHVEADTAENNLRALQLIAGQGKRCGLTLKPATSADALKPFLPYLDLVLIMTVEPGFGGQSFMSDQLEKIRAVRNMLDSLGKPCELEVDGGIDVVTAPLAVEAGCDVLVAGSSVFGKKNRAEAVAALRNACNN